MAIDVSRHLALSPDGRRLALSSSSTVSLRDAETGREVKIVDPARGHVVFGPGVQPRRTNPGRGPHQDDHAQTRSSGCGTASGQEVLTLRGHPDRVFAVAFSPDGRRLASACMDGTVWLWDVATGKAVLSLRGHSHKVKALAFSPDGRKLLIGDETTLKLWDATPDDPGTARPSRSPGMWSSSSPTSRCRRKKSWPESAAIPPSASTRQFALDLAKSAFAARADAPAAAR